MNRKTKISILKSNKLSKWKLSFYLSSLLILISFAFAAPSLDYTSPTLFDNSYTSSDWAEVNITINEENLSHEFDKDLSSKFQNFHFLTKFENHEKEVLVIECNRKKKPLYSGNSIYT